MNDKKALLMELFKSEASQFVMHFEVHQGVVTTWVQMALREIR